MEDWNTFGLAFLVAFFVLVYVCLMRAFNLYKMQKTLIIHHYNAPTTPRYKAEQLNNDKTANGNTPDKPKTKFFPKNDEEKKDLNGGKNVDINKSVANGKALEEGVANRLGKKKLNLDQSNKSYKTIKEKWANPLIVDCSTLVKFVFWKIMYNFHYVINFLKGENKTPKLVVPVRIMFYLMIKYFFIIFILQVIGFQYVEYDLKIENLIKYSSYVIIPSLPLLALLHIIFLHFFFNNLISNSVDLNNIYIAPDENDRLIQEAKTLLDEKEILLKVRKAQENKMSDFFFIMFVIMMTILFAVGLKQIYYGKQLNFSYVFLYWFCAMALDCFIYRPFLCFILMFVWYIIMVGCDRHRLARLISVENEMEFQEELCVQEAKEVQKFAEKEQFKKILKIGYTENKGNLSTLPLKNNMVEAGSERKFLDVTYKEKSANGIRNLENNEEIEISDYEESGKPRTFSFALTNQFSINRLPKNEKTDIEANLGENLEEQDFGNEKLGNPNVDEDNIYNNQPYNHHISSFQMEVAKRNLDINVENRPNENRHFMENLDYSKISIEGIGGDSNKHQNDSGFIDRHEMPEMWNPVNGVSLQNNIINESDGNLNGSLNFDREENTKAKANDGFHNNYNYNQSHKEVNNGLTPSIYLNGHMAREENPYNSQYRDYNENFRGIKDRNMQESQGSSDNLDLGQEDANQINGGNGYNFQPNYPSNFYSNSNSNKGQQQKEDGKSLNGSYYDHEEGDNYLRGKENDAYELSTNNRIGDSKKFKSRNIEYSIDSNVDYEDEGNMKPTIGIPY